MTFFIQVIFWLIFITTLLKLFYISNDIYPRITTINMDIGDAIFNFVILIWAAYLLWS